MIKMKKWKLLGCLWLAIFLLCLFSTASLAADMNMNPSENTASTATTTSSNLPTSSSSTTVSNMLPESELGLSTILSILLITVGVILILLAIAILIRLK